VSSIVGFILTLKGQAFSSILCNTFIEELFVDAPNCEGISEHIEYFNNLKN
jgi:hypothetical protein